MTSPDLGQLHSACRTLRLILAPNFRAASDLSGEAAGTEGVQTWNGYHWIMHGIQTECTLILLADLLRKFDFWCYLVINVFPFGTILHYHFKHGLNLVGVFLLLHNDFSKLSYLVFHALDAVIASFERSLTRVAIWSFDLLDHMTSYLY